MNHFQTVGRSGLIRTTATASLAFSLILTAHGAESTDPQIAAAGLNQLAEPYVVVVTATRTARPLTETLADVTLIDREQIRRSGAVSVADLLQRQHGLQMTRNGGPGTTSSMYIRGADTRFTAAYIDGVRVDSQSTGGPPWEAISLSQIERIEIVRGPAAAVYGSDAVAGVIQIFTRKGQGPFTPYVELGAGNRRTWELGAGFSGNQGALDYSLGISREGSRGYNGTTTGNPDRDGYQQQSASGRLGLQLNTDHRLELTGSWTDMDARYDGFLPSLDDHGLNRLATAGLAWTAEWTPHYSTRLTINESHQRYETVPSPYLSKTRLRNYLLHNEWRARGHVLSADLERREDHLINEPIDRGRHQNGIALGYGYSGGPHTIQVNARYDRDSEFGGQGTGGLAYGYTFAQNWRVTAAAGTAFRVPTLYHRFSEYGASGLEPEKSRNLELGVHWDDGDSRFGLTVYRNHIRNLIEFGPPGPCAGAFGCYYNAGSVHLRGVTLSGQHEFGAVSLGGSIDLQKPTNAVSGQTLARRPTRSLKLNAQTMLSGWTLGAEWILASSRWDDPGHTTRLGGYGVANLYASKTIQRDWEFLARVDNLTNKNYELASTYRAQPVQVYVGLRWTPH